MGDEIPRSLVAGLVLGLILCLPPLAAAAPTQDNDSIFAGRPVPVARVTRVPRKRRKVGRGRRTVMRVPLLAIQLRLYKVKDDGTQVETSPQSQFYPGDRLRLGVKANQRGYLTIIQQRDPDQDGQILFPTSRLNDGGNYVEANREFVVPSNCPAEMRAADCAYVVPAGAGRALFTFVFSRDAIVDLPERAITSAGMIQAQVIKELEQESGQQLDFTSGTQASRYALLVVNNNRKDNEEIVTRRGILVGDGPPPPNGTPRDSNPTPTDTPAPDNRNDQPPPANANSDPAGSTATVNPDQPKGDKLSGVLIALGALGISGVLVAAFYILRGGGRFGR